MAYFKSEDSYAEHQKNEGFFRVDDCTSIAVVGEYQGYKTAFAIHGPRQKHILVAESRYVRCVYVCACAVCACAVCACAVCACAVCVCVYVWGVMCVWTASEINYVSLLGRAIKLLSHYYITLLEICEKNVSAKALVPG